MPPQVVSTGLEHLLVALPDLETMARLRPNLAALDTVLTQHGALGCFVFCLKTTSPAVFAHARMFAPGAGVPEDPATGSAAGPLGAYLAAHRALPPDRETFFIEQGIEMSRPSRIWVEVTRDTAGLPVKLRVGGATVPVIRGTIEI